MSILALGYRKGHAFLACNSSNVFPHGIRYREEETMQERQARTEKAGGRTRKEQLDLCLFLSRIKSVTEQCLLMPYFDQRSEMRTEGTPFPRFGSHLERFQERNLQYDMNDLRWRHVGIRNSMVCLFDLGSLRDCPAVDNDYIIRSIQLLDSRISQQCQAALSSEQSWQRLGTSPFES